MNAVPVHLGISTCPNDTFAFFGILERTVDFRGLDFRVELLDVQELNARLFRGDFDVAKASFHAALRLSDELGVLSVGSALGYGAGPLLLAARPGTHPRADVPASRGARRARVLCPGEHTTATLLYRLFHPAQGRLEQVVFSDIMPALQAQTADFGVCIHEGRFTWRAQGLARVEDLGEVWEQDTGSPLPLGGILARHRLGREVIDRVTAVLKDSLRYAQSHRERTLPTLRRYAQELTDEVLFAHVDLYVNQWTEDLGDGGRRALAVLAQKAAEVGVVSPGAAPLVVF